MNTKRVFISGISSLLGLGLIAGLQAGSDAFTKSFQIAQSQAAYSFNEPLVPSAATLRVVSFGEPQLAADVLWLDTIQYFGAGNPYGSYPSLGHLLDTITQLDPKFEYPYEFGMVVLPFMKQADAAITLGERAQTALPPNGLLDYYHASNYLLNTKDYTKAAFYYKKAATEPGAPGAASEMAGVALSKLSGTLNDRIVAINYWQTVADNAKTDDARTQALKWKSTLEIVYSLESAAQQYKTDHGSYPASLQVLVDTHYISQIPTSPIGFGFDLDPTTGTVNYN